MSMKKISRRDFLKAAGIVTVAGTLTACGGGSSASTSAVASGSTAAAGGKYTIALSNAFMGNDWRQIMIKCAEVVPTKEPYASKLDLTIINSENSAEAQSAAIDAMVEQGYNAILVDASSSSALLPSIKRAQDAGIVVVSFDSIVVADGVYTVQTDFISMVEAWAKYLCNKCGEGAKIAVDTGMPGSTNGNTIYEAAMSVFQDSNMNVVSEFASQYADGVCQEQLASVLAANPDLKCIVGTCDAHIVGATSAAEQLGLAENLIMGAVDGSKAAYEIMLDNGPIVALGLNSPYEVGEAAVRVILGYLNDGTIPVAKTLQLEPTLVTPENVQDYYDPNSAF